LAAGCVVGPNYQPPKAVAPGQWGEPLAGGATNRAVAAARWWTAFNDPTLNSLIERAVQSNHDLLIAAARVRQARASYDVAKADFSPSIDAAGSYTRQRASKNSNPLVQARSLENNVYQTGFDAAWEIDVFGGTRRAVESAAANIAAAEFGRDDVLVSLLAEVALNYAEVRGYQSRLAIARDNLKSERDSLEITRAKFAGGVSSELDVAQAIALEATTRSQVPPLETARQTAIHHLDTLLGQSPGALLEELSKDAPVPAAPPEVPVGLPADLLRRRPDVRQAERQLASATALIGVATADLFPKFGLNGAAGLESYSAGDWFRNGSKFWSLGPTAQWRIFDAGRIRANIRLQNALQEQALESYEKTALTAMEDVENALVAYAKEQVHYLALKDAVEANRRSLELANQLYSRGLVDFLNVVQAQTSLYQSQDQLAQSEIAVSTDVIALYKALGGGWDDRTVARRAVDAQRKPR
jgi:NodT family efflux transporter outer membrane factor (OMF) lipoprotein